MSFPHNLNLIRKAQGLSQEAFAEKLGITRVILSNYETGKTPPPLEIVTKIAQMTGISIDNLLYQILRRENIPDRVEEPPEEYTTIRNLYDIRDLVDAVKQLQDDVAELKKKG
jgi:transcriptional regulator with XRE-family HTH domain